MVTSGYSFCMNTNPTTQNHSYNIFVYEAKAATYDEYDGFGDYKNYGARRLFTVGAHSEEHALKVAMVSDNYDQIFWAKLAD